MTIALVTGAGSGIGRRVTGALLDAGYAVVATDLRQDALAAAAREDRWPEESAVLRALDVRDAAAWTAVVDETVARFGSLDVLLNIAGFLNPAPLLSMTKEDVDRHIDVNLKGLIHGTRAAAAVMVPRGRGHIVNIGSLAALSPVPGLGLYAASKFGVRGFSLSVAYELEEKGVALTVIYPDAVKTPMLDLQRDHPEAALTFSGTPLTVDDIARVLLEKVLPKRPLEVALPTSRGLLSKLAGFAPALGFKLVPMLTRKGLRRQHTPH